MTQEAREYLHKLRTLPFEQFIEWRQHREGTWLTETKRASGRRGRAQPPEEK